MSWQQKLVRWMALGVVFGGMAWGQNTGQNVVNVQILAATNYTVGTYTITSGNLQNIGQTGHQVTMITSCLASTISIQNAVMQGSADGNNWIPIGPLITTQLTSASTATVVNGYRAYPYLRFTTNITTGATCTVRINYTGNSSPSLVVSDALGSISNLSTYPNTLTNTSGTTWQTLPLAQSSGQRVTIYGLLVSAPATGTLFDLGCGATSLTVSAPILTWGVYGVAKDLILPVNIRPMYQCPVAGDGLWYRFTGTGGFNVTLFWRGE